MELKNAGIIDVMPLWPGLEKALIDLLESLDDADWQRTAVGHWSVRDLAAHLLDTDLRRLSFQRDRQPMPEPAEAITDYRSLVLHLDRLNADWVTAFARLSPRALIDLLRWSGPQVHELFRQLDPREEAFFAVAWAGQSTSPNWFDVAREYTEKWHHQQQIRDATERPGMCQRRWSLPVIDAFLRALPHRYESTSADPGARIVIEVGFEVDTGEEAETGDCDGRIEGGQATECWTLERENAGWRLWRGADGQSFSVITRLILNADTTWRLMSKGLSPDEARKRTKIEGDLDLARPFFDTLAVMA